MRTLFVLLAVVIAGSVQAGTFSIQQKQSVHRGAEQSAPPEDMTGLMMVSGTGKSMTADGDGGMVHRGSRPARAEKVSAQRHSRREKYQAVKDALEYIVPSGFDVFTNDSKILADECGFSGAGEWDEMLGDVLYDNEATKDIRTTIDWDRKQVILRRELPEPVAAEKAAPVVVKYFDVKMSDGFLSKTLNRWCLESPVVCRQVRWNADFEIVIEADAPKIGTEFVESVDSVFESLSTSIRGHRFHYLMSPNGVLIVSE